MVEDARLKKLVSMKFPAGSAHEYERVDPATGEVKNKAIMSFPRGMKADGKDLGDGWYMVVFRTDFIKKQIDAGGEILLSVHAYKKNKNTGEIGLNYVKVFRGPGKDAESMEMNPWSLAIGLRSWRTKHSKPILEPGEHYEGNADSEDSYGQTDDDPLEGRRREPETSPAPLAEEEDSFVSRSKRMRSAAHGLASAHAR